MSHIHPLQLFLNLPLELRFHPMHGSYRVDTYLLRDRMAKPLFRSGVNHRDKGFTQEINSSDPFWAARKEESPWTVRKEFFADIMDGYAGFELFTYFYGRFGIGPADLQFEQPNPRPSGRFLNVFLQRDFEEWQVLIRTAMKIPIEKWASLIRKFPERKVRVLQRPLPLTLEWRKGRPVGVVILRTAVDAIIASIQIDKLNGVEFRYCARPDCQRPYKIESRHKRIYCSTDCAHYMAVKSSRKRAARKSKSHD
jgi:hypothetical protein